MSLSNLIECFDLFHFKAYPGYRLLDNFSDCISFYSCNCFKGSTIKAYFQALDCLCYGASTDPSILVIVTDASVILSRNI